MRAPSQRQGHPRHYPALLCPEGSGWPLPPGAGSHARGSPDRGGGQRGGSCRARTSGASVVTIARYTPESYSELAVCRR